MKPAVLGLFAIGLAGCATTESAGSEATDRTVAYRCMVGPDLSIAYAGDVARVDTADGQSVTLNRQPAAGGLLYEAADHSLRVRGDELIYIAGRNRAECREGLIPR